MPTDAVPAPPLSALPWRRRHRLQLPPGGRGWLLVAAALTLIGLIRGINLLLLFGYALFLTAALNVWLASRQVRGLSGRRRIAGPIFAGVESPVEIELTNPGRGRRGLVLEDRGAGEDLCCPVPVLEAGATCRVRGLSVPLRRGRHHWGGLWVGSSYPFGLLGRARLLAAPEDVLVLPALGRLRRDRLRLPGGLEAVRRPSRHAVVTPGAQAELHGLRDYRPGDSPRAVHWRSSARRGRLLVREFEEPPGDELLVVLDPGLPDDSAAGRAAVEAAVSLAATVCWEWARSGRWLGLVVAAPQPVVLGGAADRSHAVRLLAALAVAEAGPRAAPAVLQAALRARHLPAAAVLLVAAGPSPLEVALRQARRGRVHALDPDDPSVRAFYEPPAPGDQP
jgi:uncharacterized protein (DUF58 family)